MCSIKTLFLEILKNPQKKISVLEYLFNKVAAFRPINSIIKCISHAVLYW